MGKVRPKQPLAEMPRAFLLGVVHMSMQVQAAIDAASALDDAQGVLTALQADHATTQARAAALASQVTAQQAAVNAAIMALQAAAATVQQVV